MMRTYDKQFRFWVDVGNAGNRATLDLLLNKNAMPGFNDSGAHITNMAFFDANLMSLKLAQAQSLQTVSTMVKRLTREPAEFFGLDVGTLEIGAQADIVLLDPRGAQGLGHQRHARTGVPRAVQAQADAQSLRGRGETRADQRRAGVAGRRGDQRTGRSAAGARIARCVSDPACGDGSA